MEQEKNDFLSEGFFWILDETLSITERLNWIFAFADKDLEVVPIEDRHRFAEDLEKYLFRKTPYSGKRPNLFIVDTKPLPEELGSVSNFERIKALKLALGNLLKSLESLFHADTRETVTLGDMQFKYDIALRRGRPEPTFFVTYNVSGDDHQRLIHELLGLLNGQPIHFFGRCRVCNRQFHNPKKGTLFCSKECRWVSNSKKYRESHQQEVNKKQKIRAQKRYDEKILKELGPKTAEIVKKKRLKGAG